MKKRYWFLAVCLPMVVSSCNFYDKVFGDFVVQRFPDTLVLSIDPDKTEVQYLVNDSTYSIIRYWMDGNGVRIFKCMEEHYKRGRLNGERYEWNKQGVLIHASSWDDGIKVGFAKEIFPNDTLHQQVQYANNGNRQFENNYHRNGRKQTDSIIYDNGKLEGDVSYYDSLGSKTETYVYKNDILMGVRLFKKQYVDLEARARGMEAQMKKDSIEDAIYKAEHPDTISVANDEW